MVSLSALAYAILYIIVAALVFWLLNYLLDNVGLGEPFHKVGKVILLVFAVFVVIGILLSMLGGVQVFRP